MGVFEKVFGKRESPAKNARLTFELLDGYSPAFHTWEGSIYESDLIRAALDAIGRHAAKLSPTIQGSAKENLRNRLKIMPNEFQTWPQFLYRLAVILYARNTAFTVPVLGEYGETNGIISVVPRKWELVEYQDNPFIRFYFDKRKNGSVELWRAGIMTRFQYGSELFGEDNDALKPTLDLIEMQRQGIEEGIKNGATYRFSAQSDNWSTDEDLTKEASRFDEYAFRKKKGGGMLLFPNTYRNIQQLKQEAYKVDADQMKLIKENVFDYFGVNEDVIQNKTFGDNWLAFYEGCIEWFAIQASEVITKMLFSERERQFGNRVFFTSNRLQYMSNADKMNAISQMADRGLMTRNELRDILNLSPLPEPWGSQIPARGEYYNVNETEANENAGEN